MATMATLKPWIHVLSMTLTDKISFDDIILKLIEIRSNSTLNRKWVNGHEDFRTFEYVVLH